MDQLIHIFINWFMFFFLISWSENKNISISDWIRLLFPSLNAGYTGSHYLTNYSQCCFCFHCLLIIPLYMSLIFTYILININDIDIWFLWAWLFLINVLAHLQNMSIIERQSGIMLKFVSFLILACNNCITYTL